MLDRFRDPSRFRSAPRYSLGATFAEAGDEARRRGDRKVSTEHLLLALLHDPGSARAVGRDVEAARAALDRLDREALLSIGVGPLPEAPPVPGRERNRLPLTPAAKAVVVRAAQRSHRLRPGPERVLLALLDRARPDPAAELLAALGVDAAAVRGRIGEPAARP